MEPTGDRLTGVDAWVRRHPWAPDTALALVLAGVLAPTSLTVIAGSDPSPPIGAAVVAAVLVAHATVALRRVMPRAAYAICCLAMLVLVGAPDLAGDPASGIDGPVPPILLPSALVFTVLLYSVAASTRRPYPAAALALALVGALLTVARLWSVDDWPAGAQPQTGGAVSWRLFVAAALVAAVLAPWALGRFRAVRAAYVDSLAERARRAESERAERAAQAAAAERARIAREMHDVVAHSLAVIVRQAEGGRLIAARDPERAAQALEAVAATGREALGDMRSMLDVLRDGQPADTGPQPTVDDVPTLVDRIRSTGLAVELRRTGDPGPLDRGASLAAYRVVQESLTNVVKHAAGARAVVNLDWDGEGLVVEVRDSGVPGQDDRVGFEPGHGLAGMRERVVLAGGTLQAGPDDDRGFAVRARLPLRGRALDRTEVSG